MCRQTGSCREDDRRPERCDSAGKTTGRLAPQRGARFRRTITRIYGKYENKALAISLREGDADTMMMELVLIAVVIRIIGSIIVVDGNAYLRYAET